MTWNEAERAWGRARNRAIRELIRRHQQEYDDLFAKERETARAEDGAS